MSYAPAMLCIYLGSVRAGLQCVALLRSNDNKTVPAAVRTYI